MKEITGSREGRCALIKIFAILLIVYLFQTSADAADTVRISISNLSGQFMTFPLAHK